MTPFKFKRVITPEIKGKEFDLKETVMKAGEPYCYYDRIQSARADTEIIETLHKYGCLDKMIVNKELVYADITDFKNTDYRSLKEMTMKADEMWNKLPAEIKAKFENNRDIFMRDGEKWLKEEIEKTQPKEPIEQEQTKEEATNE